MESSVHSSLHSNWHHQIACAKFNLKIHYPPPYECEAGHYQRGNTDHIREAIEQFVWDMSFNNLDANEMVQTTTTTNLQTIFLLKLSSVVTGTHLRLIVEPRT